MAEHLLWEQEDADSSSATPTIHLMPESERYIIGMPMATPEEQSRYQREWMARRRRLWLEENGPCVRCGSCESLEVDHIDPTTKVSHNVWSWAEERRLKELAKCQVLCQPCHRQKTLENGEHARGESFTRSRLTENDVRWMRHQHSLGSLTLEEIGRPFGMDKRSVFDVVRRRTWKHI